MYTTLFCKQNFFQLLDKVGIGAKVYAVFQNGMILEFVKGSVLTWGAFSDPKQTK